MAPAAFGDFSMRRMTIGTKNSCMLGYISLQHVVDRLVATSADGRICVLSIDYLQWLVHGMTGHAVLHRKLHIGTVGFMTRTAFGDEAMFVGVAVDTAHLGRMLAEIALQLLIDIVVAKATRGLGL